MRKNHPSHGRKIQIDSFPVQYYSDPDHPEVHKAIDMDQKMVFINTYGDYDGIVVLVQDV